MGTTSESITVGAEQGRDLAQFEMDIDAVDRAHGAEAAMHPIELDSKDRPRLFSHLTYQGSPVNIALRISPEWPVWTPFATMGTGPAHRRRHRRQG